MTEVTLDEVDFKILRRLDEHGDVDVDELSDELGVSTSTIYYRMEKYRDQGIVTGNITQLDPQKVGLGLTAITEINATYAGPGYEEVAEKLMDLSGVQRVFFMLGEMSFYVLSRVKDHEHLQRLMEAIIQTEGIENSTTNIVLRTFKDENRLLVNYNDEDLERIFSGE
ncbi:DNA-binding transcriptional regulator, Lrp family [Halogranum amylolyticum]|uniref:DNA-binding transcriptional regulator, Lrp family n=1 Tax=Halogranum amylolyticum TaxID=660520 RepID=A0A1H8MSW0_9EURY|nr:Lrp/AsnC family transcriptional regulator [Halogranum amylolyticum]SEO20437.1 DNA-binding transcriptional regulator, Lrp family [Halogranum amylolyticum]